MSNKIITSYVDFFDNVRPYYHSSCSNLTFINFSFAVPCCIKFEKCVFENINFLNMLGYVDFKDCTFTNCTFDNLIFTGVYFDKCSFNHVNFSSCVFEVACFFSCSLPKDNSFIDCKINALRFMEDCSKVDFSYNYSPAFSPICPEGDIIGYKQVIVEENKIGIAKLLIPKDAKRSNSTSRKCRCDKAKVLSITSYVGCENYTIARSEYDTTFIYEVGKTIQVNNFDENRWNECAPGIHFFLTREEAIDY